ncbi:MAG: ThuA domain-containing protein [Thermoguttaceae bacterium]|jgi:type 1 glutamine amidotransferase
MKTWLFSMGLLVLASVIALGGMARAADPPHKKLQGRHLVFVIDEDEYHADRTLPAFARQLTAECGCRCTILQGGKGGISGLDALTTADLMVLFARRKPLPREQLQAIRAYLEGGRPLLALRTACHAFCVAPGQGPPPPGTSQWPTFDVDVLGCHYVGHYGNEGGTDVAPVAGAAGDPLLAGVEPARWHSNGSLYKVLPLDRDAKLLLSGAADDHRQPVAWTRAYRGGRVFATTLGHPDDFAQPQFRNLLINAIDWATASNTLNGSK